MSRVASRTHRRWNRAHAVARTAVAMAFGVAFCGAAAQARTGAQQPVPVAIAGDAAANLEKAFWACDRAAARGPIDTGDAMACSVVAEALKNSRFGGDFGAMHAWWQRSRSAGHRPPDVADSERIRR